MTASHSPATNCPCCSYNPWSKATEGYFVNLCQECEAKQEQLQAKKAIDPSNMDLTILPSCNFYNYANGNWIKNNPIPAGYPSWNSFMTLRVKSQENCHEILKDLLLEMKNASSSEGSHCGDTTEPSYHGTLDSKEEKRKVAIFYQSGMDENSIETDGIQPLQSLLKLCASSADKRNDAAAFASSLGTMAYKYQVCPFFHIGSDADKMESGRSIAQVYQGGIGLPDRDYYFDDDKEEIREKYKKAMGNLFLLLESQQEENMPALVDKVYNLEKTLAEAHMTKTENRDPHSTYNKMTIPDLSRLCDHCFDFSAYFEAATGKTVEELGEVNVRNVAAVKRVAELIAGKSQNDIGTPILEAYFRWMVIISCAPYMSKQFVEAHFDFFERTLQGTKELKPRWKRVMEFTESALGEALGKLYCAKHFDESYKQRAFSIVEQVRQALEDRLKEVDWIKSEETRQNALKKMARFGVKIGYPEKWRDYSSLVLDEGEPFLNMVFKAREFSNTYEIKEMNAPTDRAKWYLTPQTVNAYYHPSLNEIVFPAAILQSPFFDKDADDAVNFGSMGAIIGHEMTHGFDDKGRKFDSEGNMVDWWTKEDAQEYERRVDVMVEQANKFEVHGQLVKGKLTSGENIADLGGLRLALRALLNCKDYDPNHIVDGFTPIQRFFLSWAQCWRQNVTKERALQLLTIDPHGPNELRCNGPLSNMSEFHHAFSVKDIDPMFKPEQHRVDIW